MPTVVDMFDEDRGEAGTIARRCCESLSPSSRECKGRDVRVWISLGDPESVYLEIRCSRCRSSGVGETGQSGVSELFVPNAPDIAVLNTKGAARRYR